jgi:Family of unknown function (DUF6843)
MVPFILYFVAGLLTALHIYRLLSLAIFGVPHTVLELLSLLGSLGLVVSAYVGLFKAHVAAKVALPASLVTWCFYAPGVVATLKAAPHHPLSGLWVAALPYLAVVSLVLVTVYSAFVSFSRRPVDQPVKWFFPDHTMRPVRMAVGLCTMAAIVGLAAWCTVDAKESARRSSRFLIPAGYVGWVRVEFQVPGSSPVPVDAGQYIFKIPQAGFLKTCSPEQYGWAKDQYYYYSANGLSMLPTGAGPGALIWGQINGEEGSSSASQKYQEFFVGTEQQFKQQAGQQKIDPNPVGVTHI